MPSPQKATRTDDAYAQLKIEIRSNRIPPGYLAPEPEIALRLGMSRTPVREALIRLETEGLVELIPRRGARVLPISATDMKEIYEILTALEPEAAACVAARNLSETELKSLDDATTRMEQALAQQDLDSWADADDDFHRRLLELHGNRRMTEYVGLLFDQAHRARMVTLRLREPPVKSTQEHRDILEHLRSGDSEATRVVFRNHRKRATDELLKLLHNFKLPQL